MNNEPTKLSDPYGLSPADVQRIKDKCKRCTQSLTNGGYRLAGSGWPMGLKNDQKRNWNWLTGKHLFGCKEQAAQNVPCLDDKGYDSHWTFSEWDWWLGLHTVVRARAMIRTTRSCSAIHGETLAGRLFLGSPESANP